MIENDHVSEEATRAEYQGIVYIAEELHEEYEIDHSEPPLAAPQPHGQQGADGWTQYDAHTRVRVMAKPTGRYFGHWESACDGHPVLVETGPGWADVEEAIAWGRARAPIVLVRVGYPPQVYYSAGERTPSTLEALPWPPAEHVNGRR